MSKKTAYYLPSNISFVFVVEFNCFPATWMCTSTMQDWTYPLISAKQAVLNLSQMEDFLSSPAILLTEKKKISKVTEGKQNPCCSRWRGCRAMHGEREGWHLGSFFISILLRTNFLHRQAPHKRVNHKLIILKKINTNDSCLYIAGVVLTYISRLGFPGLDPAALICFYPVQPEAT